MNTRINGMFVQNGSYYGLRDAETRHQLADMLASIFPKGAIVEVDLNIEMVGMRDICQAPTKYGVCGDVLDEDGTCHATNHVEPEPEREPEEPEEVSGLGPFKAI